MKAEAANNNRPDAPVPIEISPHVRAKRASYNKQSLGSTRELGV
jgi:hypothetical protein